MKLLFNCRSTSVRSVLVAGAFALAGVVYAAFSNSEVLVTTADTDGASISASGARIAYRQFGASGASSIKVRYGGTTYDLTTGYLHHVGRPRISRDGLFVGFFGATASNVAMKPYCVKIGSAPVALSLPTAPSGGDQPPAVSDDLGNGYARLSYLSPKTLPGTLLDPNRHQSLVVVDCNGSTATSEVPITPVSGVLSDGIDPAISADGSVVFFTLQSSNQIRVTTAAGSWSVTSEVISTGASGVGNGASREASCSGDGNYVAFASNSSNFHGSDGGGNYDVYVRNRSGASLTRAYTGNYQSMAIGGYDASAIEMSPDGTYVAFHSGSDDILPLSFCSLMQNYVHTTVYLSEWSTQTTEAVAFHPDVNGDPDCLVNGVYPSISDEADHIGFQSDVPGIVSGDNDGYLNVLHKWTHI